MMTDDWQYLQFKMTAFWADPSCHPKSHSLTCSVFFCICLAWFARYTL